MKDFIWICEVSTSQGLSYPAHIYFHISLKRIIRSICKAHTSVVIYVNFKENQSGTQKQAYFDPKVLAIKVNEIQYIRLGFYRYLIDSTTRASTC